MEQVKITSLTHDRLAEALAVFQNSGWHAESLFYVKAEMQAFLQGDIEGYIRARFVLAAVHDQVIGVAAWAPAMCAFAVYELSWATVLPEWRHRGINSLMLTARLQEIRLHHGAQPFSVIVYTWDNPMYAEAGFMPTADGMRFPDPSGKRLLTARFGVDECL